MELYVNQQSYRMGLICSIEKDQEIIHRGGNTRAGLFSILKRN